MSDNTITLTGNITRDPELRYTSGGVAVCNFRVASTRRIKDNNTGEWKDGDALFLRCTIWRQAAEHVAESLTRGDRVVVCRAGCGNARSRPARARSAPSSSWRSTRSGRLCATPPSPVDS